MECVLYTRRLKHYSRSCHSQNKVDGSNIGCLFHNLNSLIPLCRTQAVGLTAASLSAKGEEDSQNVTYLIHSITNTNPVPGFGFRDIFVLQFDF